MINPIEADPSMHECLKRIDAKLDMLIKQRAVKHWYSTSEFAQIVGRAEFTVREWCRLSRIHAKKRACGRGPTLAWSISHEELVRFQNHGLLPGPTVSSRY